MRCAAGILFTVVVAAGCNRGGTTSGAGGTTAADGSRSGAAVVVTPTPVTKVKWSGPGFIEAAAAAGIDFHHFHGGKGDLNFIETMGGGVALFDYDADGDLDAYLVQSGYLPGETGERDSRSQLFRNRGDGHFDRVTDESGAANAGSYGMGVSAADYDNDGLVDLYVLNFEANRLYHNLGGGRFEDVTEVARVGDSRWSVSAAWGDFNVDGLLDIYVANYIDFTMDNNIWCGRKAENIRAYCHPDQYHGVPPRLYQNRGDGTFVDVSDDAGVVATVGKGLGAIASDLDNDGDLDIFGANDSTINYTWRNRGDGTFEDYSLLSGSGFNEDGKPQACMGTDVADYNRDGKFDLFVTNLDIEYNTLYRNVGGMTFIDSSFMTGLADEHVLLVGFGTEFIDFDLDGWQDLIIANGHIINNIDQLNDIMAYAQPKSLFRNERGERFVEVSGGMTSLNHPQVSRGLASGDLDGDGDVDFLTGSNGEDRPAELFLNDGEPQGGFLVVETEGRASNRQAIGAVLTIDVGGRKQYDEVHAGSSYASSSDPRVTFGLGSATTVDSLVVRWPAGTSQTFTNLPANSWVRVVEGIAEPIVRRR